MTKFRKSRIKERENTRWQQQNIEERNTIDSLVILFVCQEKERKRENDESQMEKLNWGVMQKANEECTQTAKVKHTHTHTQKREKREKEMRKAIFHILHDPFPTHTHKHKCTKENGWRQRILTFIHIHAITIAITISYGITSVDNQKHPAKAI